MWRDTAGDKNSKFPFAITRTTTDHRISSGVRSATNNFHLLATTCGAHKPLQHGTWPMALLNRHHSIHNIHDEATTNNDLG